MNKITFRKGKQIIRIAPSLEGKMVWYLYINGYKNKNTFVYEINYSYGKFIYGIFYNGKSIFVPNHFSTNINNYFSTVLDAKRSLAEYYAKNHI
jgi:hypothetical protein